MVQLMCPKDFVPTGTPKTNRKICNMKEKVRVDGMDAVMTNLNKIWINGFAWDINTKFFKSPLLVCDITKSYLHFA